MNNYEKTILSIINNDFTQELKDRYPKVQFWYPKPGEITKFIVSNQNVYPPEFYVEMYVDSNYFPKSYEIKEFVGLLLTRFLKLSTAETTVMHLLNSPDCQVSFRGWNYASTQDNKSYFDNIVSIAARTSESGFTFIPELTQGI